MSEQDGYCTAIAESTGKRCQRRHVKGEKLCASHMKGIGRKSKIHAAWPKIIEALELGNTREGACTYAGVHVATFYRWMETGEADAEQNVESDRREFRDAVTRAEGLAEHTLVAELRRAASGFVNPSTGKREGNDWRAAAWLLERRHPSRWGRQPQEVKLSGSLRQDPPEVPDDQQRMDEVSAVLRDIGAV